MRGKWGSSRRWRLPGAGRAVRALRPGPAPRWTMPPRDGKPAAARDSYRVLEDEAGMDLRGPRKPTRWCTCAGSWSTPRRTPPPGHARRTSCQGRHRTGQAGTHRRTRSTLTPVPWPPASRRSPPTPRQEVPAHRHHRLPFYPSYLHFTNASRQPRHADALLPTSPSPQASPPTTSTLTPTHSNPLLPPFLNQPPSPPTLIYLPATLLHASTTLPPPNSHLPGYPPPPHPLHLHPPTSLPPPHPHPPRRRPPPIRCGG